MDKYGVTSEGFKRKPYLKILEDMQIRARELFGSNINLSERSSLGMFLQAIAWEISQSWEEIEESHYNNFSLYANGINLDNVISNNGRVRFDGTKSKTQIKIIGSKNTIVPEGFLCSTENGKIFETLKEVTLIEESALVDIIALEIGSDKNVPKGTITKIVNPIAGVISINNPSEATGGSDVESDESLRLRNLEALREPTTGDNLSQYKLWAREVKGVGGIKVQPVTPTKGFVTIIISDENGQPADTDLVDRVHAYIDDRRPVNAGIVVKSATSLDIIIKATIILAEGYLVTNIEDTLKEKIEGYFREISLEETYVSYAKVGGLILEVEGVLDYSNLTLNSKQGNIALGSTEVANLKTLTLDSE